MTSAADGRPTDMPETPPLDEAPGDETDSVPFGQYERKSDLPKGVTGMTRAIAGVLPVLATPFAVDESIDYDALAELVDWQYRQGADGLTIAMVSEMLRLTDAERCELVERVVVLNRDRGVVVVSVGAESTSMALERARHAESVGANAVMAIPPTTVTLDDDEQYAYFSRIADAVALPLIVQDASGYVGTPLSTTLQARLLLGYGPQKVAFKPEAPPLGQRLQSLLDATDATARAFEGSGGQALMDTHPRGVVGTMPGSDLVWAIVALWRALESQQVRRARTIHAALTPLLSLAPGLDGYIALEKYLLCKQGVLPNRVVRGPVAYRLDGRTELLVDYFFEDLYATVHGSSGTDAALEVATPGPRAGDPRTERTP